MPLIFEAVLLAYCAAVGFVAAGIFASFYQLVTTRPAAFGIADRGPLRMFLTLIGLAMTGPVLVMRGALRARAVDRQPLSWMVVGLGVTALWSACSGIVLLDLALGLRHSLA